MNPTWLLPDDFEIRLTFTSDWHVGSGAGRPGLIDRLVTRDEDDCPFVPAKTLTGIWRDACERVACAWTKGKERPGRNTLPSPSAISRRWSSFRIAPCRRLFPFGRCGFPIGCGKLSSTRPCCARR